MMYASLTITTLLASLGQVLGGYPASVLLVAKFGGNLSPPSECSGKDQSILQKMYIPKVAATKIKMSPSFALEETAGTFRVEYSLEDCANPNQMADLKAALADTVQNVSPGCQAAIKSSESISCIAIYDSDPLSIKKEVKKDKEGVAALSGYCSPFCEHYCYFVQDCYCDYVDSTCACCNCPAC